MITALDRGFELASSEPEDRPFLAQAFRDSETRAKGGYPFARYARSMEGLPYPELEQSVVEEDRQWFENMFRSLGWGVYNVDGRPQVQPVDDDKCSDETAWMLARMYGMKIDDQGYVVQES